MEIVQNFFEFPTSYAGKAKDCQSFADRREDFHMLEIAEDEQNDWLSSHARTSSMLIETRVEMCQSGRKRETSHMGNEMG